jgi:hypothetical protein
MTKTADAPRSRPGAPARIAMTPTPADYLVHRPARGNDVVDRREVVGDDMVPGLCVVDAARSREAIPSSTSFTRHLTTTSSRRRSEYARQRVIWEAAQPR